MKQLVPETWRGYQDALPARDLRTDRTADAGCYRDLFNKLMIAAEPGPATLDILESMY